MVQGGPIDQLIQLIDGIPIAILTTVRPDSTLHSCPMAVQALDDDGAFWFLTASNTEKVEAVRTIQRVNLAFCDGARNRYVSVSGFCELVRDRERSKQLWNASYKEWFPGGVDDPNLILLKIAVQEVEYWNASFSGMVSITGFPNQLQ
jgi:general stress protein 26